MLIVHLRADHIPGHPAIFTAGWGIGHHDPLKNFGATGSRAMVEGMLALLAKDIRIRSRVEFADGSRCAETAVTGISGRVVLAGEDVEC